MNVWLWSALLLAVAILPCVWIMLFGSNMDALIALQCASTISLLSLLLLAQGLSRASFADVAILLVLLAYPAALLFAHFFERWL